MSSHNLSSMFFPEIEKKTREEIKKFQEAKLPATINYLQKHSRFYQKLFSENKIDLNSIRTIEDLSKIPFTTKDDIQAYNDDFICVDRKKIIDYVTTSGTLGDPVVVPLTEHDLERLAYNEAISFACTGGNEEELYQLTATIDRRFMAGMAYFLGARKLGAGIIRVGSGIPELQWDTIRKIQPTALIGVPSFILKMIDYAEQHHIDYKNTSIRKAICIGEPLRNDDFTFNSLGKRIREKWDIELYSTYASTEMGAAFTECSYGTGGHHHPELLITEFVDEQGIPVAEGQPGELVITNLDLEGMPLLRFRTGDICRHYYEPCQCGRTSLRIGPIIGRRQHMIKYKGTTLYPPALYDILDNIEGIVNYVVEVYTNDIGTDEIQIRIGCVDVREQLEKEIKDHFRARLRAAPAVVFESPQTITRLQFPETGRKAIKFFDNRK
ncbi:MAG TPA: AMP-binding protein [Cytophagaceae bacterium]|nr:AMP-binding protein [Cytophagaceae bacterium]